MKRFTALAVAAAVAIPVPVALACIWDTDTLAMERERFPSSLELITGKFLRHTPEFYRWRIEDRQKRIVKEPDNLALLDDLAAAYDKVGQPAKAVEVMLSSRRRDPRRYETEANLGTFYLHSDDFARGIETIGKALEINPDAHFGREKYQKLLAEYVLDRQRSAPGGRLLPLRRTHVVDYDFASWLKLARHEPVRSTRLVEDPLTKKWVAVEEKAPDPDFGLSSSAVPKPNDTQTAYAAAVKGVLGMMKFGNFESPVLLEALGDLLAQGVNEHGMGDLGGNAGRLAARAYLKAAMHVDDENAKKAYRGLAGRLVRTHEGWSMASLEAELKAELAEARAWFAEVEKNEHQWLREGKNPEAEFARLYYADPKVSESISGRVQHVLSPANVPYWVAGLLFAWLVFRSWRKRRRAA